MLQMKKLRSEMLDGLPKATQVSDMAERKTSTCELQGLWTYYNPRWRTLKMALQTKGLVACFDFS